MPQENVKKAQALISKPSPDKKSQILVVDDELAGMKGCHLIDCDTEFYEDPNSPLLEQLLSIVSKADSQTSLHGANDNIQTYLKSDLFVSKVLLSEIFSEDASDDLKGKYTNFFSLKQRSGQFTQIIDATFPTSEFDINYQDKRPGITDELLQYKLIILDLFMGNDTRNEIEDLQKYLEKIVSFAKTKKIPPIILFSSNDVLSQKRKEFAKAAKISSAGIYILQKETLLSEEFQNIGLKVVYEQLEEQSEVATNVRNSISAWTNALEKAKEDAEATLWNLDAGAIQKIHYSAKTDSDPFDEHWNELISREYLWHIESNDEFRATLPLLDNALSNKLEFSPKTSIKYHFVVPTEQKDSRALFSHFSCMGLPPPTPFHSLHSQEIAEEFNKLVPFGSLLTGNDFLDSKKALIHITQQCDLNKINQNGKSVIFAIVQGVKVENHNLRFYSTSDLVLKSLDIDGNEYDFTFIDGGILSLPVLEFIALAKDKQYSVQCRLRHDIANLFMRASVNHITRPASQKLDRLRLIKVKVYLKCYEIKNAFCFKSSNGEDQIFEVYSGKDNGHYSFSDSDSFDLATWINITLKNESTTEYKNLDVAKLTQTLMNNPEDIKENFDELDVKIQKMNLDTSEKSVKSYGSPKGMDGYVICAIDDAKQ